MSKYANVTGLATRVFELREAGMKWDAKGGIVETIRAEFGDAYPLQTAIPLRKLYQAEKARQDATFAFKATKASVTKARDGGQGWDQIAVRTGKTVQELRKLYSGDHAAGRIYSRADGSINVRLEATTAKEAEAPIRNYGGMMG